MKTFKNAKLNEIFAKRQERIDAAKKASKVKGKGKGSGPKKPKAPKK